MADEMTRMSRQRRTVLIIACTFFTIGLIGAIVMSAFDLSEEAPRLHMTFFAVGAAGVGFAAASILLNDHYKALSYTTGAVVLLSALAGLLPMWASTERDGPFAFLFSIPIWIVSIFLAISCVVVFSFRGASGNTATVGAVSIAVWFVCVILVIGMIVGGSSIDLGTPLAITFVLAMLSSIVTFAMSGITTGKKSDPTKARATGRNLPTSGAADAFAEARRNDARSSGS